VRQGISLASSVWTSNVVLLEDKCLSVKMSSRRSAPRRWRMDDAVIAGAVSATAAVAVFVNSLHGKCVFDDFPAIV
jgi:hypothetical protein